MSVHVLFFQRLALMRGFLQQLLRQRFIPVLGGLESRSMHTVAISVLSPQRVEGGLAQGDAREL
ncbi:hypothetical protein [Burkholderia pyrrocinia]|uniref:hypothetical protein n=1 Tax=Burkholderia pyrrocinia TaxID=60550 RepID=UPI00158A1A35|nr:hypothetical protein [Burkholderia pyrrocinia]